MLKSGFNTMSEKEKENLEIHSYAKLFVKDADEQAKREMMWNLCGMLKQLLPQDIDTFTIIWATKDKNLFGCGGYNTPTQNLIYAVEQALDGMKKFNSYRNN